MISALPNSYPGKLCKFLYERAEAFGYAADKGLIILPVELIDDNSIALKRCVKGPGPAVEAGRAL